MKIVKGCIENGQMHCVEWEGWGFYKAPIYMLTSEITAKYIVGS